MKTIDVVDDDIDIGDLLERILRENGYAVRRAYSGTEALLLFSTGRPDLVLLDLMLPGLSGEEVLPKLKGVPVIVISARAGIDDRVRLLLDGAADYLPKPFDARELLARVAARLREAKRRDSEELAYGDLRLEESSRQVFAAGEPVRLTRTEFAILKRLMLSAGAVLTKSHLLDLLAEDTPDCVESSLKVHVSNLRAKLRRAAGKDYIEAVWGIGFKLREEGILPKS